MWTRITTWIFVAFAVATAYAEKPTAVNALIVTGIRDQSTAVLRETLTKAGHRVHVTEEPSADLNREKLAAYDVLVLKDISTGAGSAWTPENQRAVAAAVKEGIGLVVLHQASAGFNDDSTVSREYGRMIAGGRRGSARTDQPRDLSVTIQKHHPITRGIESFRQPADKLVRSPQITEGSQVLATVFDGREQDEPVVWVNHYGNGRVVHSLLGHDTASMKSDGFAELLIGCVEWAGEKGFRMIFDGNTLDGWEGNLRYWSVENGAIVGTNPSWKSMVAHDFLCTVEDFDDFELRIEAKVIGQRNSGIVVRTVKQRYKYPIAGYEVDMGVMRWGWIFEEGGPRQILNRDVQKELQPKIQAALKQGDFNDVVVRCIDNRIDAWINGIPFGFTETKQDVAQRLRTGKIGLQLHDGKPQVVSFRNIRVKELRRE